MKQVKHGSADYDCGSELASNFTISEFQSDWYISHKNCKAKLVDVSDNDCLLN